jgi:hypothetical protein
VIREPSRDRETDVNRGDMCPLRLIDTGESVAIG